MKVGLVVIAGLFSYTMATKVGLRPLPRNQNEEHDWNWGIGNYDDLCYAFHFDSPVNYQHMDVLMDYRGCY